MLGYSNQMRQVREEKGEEFGPGYWTEDEIISAMEPAVSDTVRYIQAQRIYAAKEALKKKPKYPRLNQECSVAHQPTRRS
ncbi:hypothetical protein I7I50_05501 [Histoplasma capsulatum G186AR]|uniref:Uncharacterized protein n=1 Tax=Ajellomyces capsulatus TaxID=5037 RepID=A0A8H7Z6V1_AJECA|nr:hypothetical protein I7I52_03762 [Histoplasma capsulatum]QSS76144.1 hypothetical protein I7I50_05501 [Histoplasma capsulatum G186AR]